MNIRIAALHRYPVKSLSPEPLSSAELKAGHHFPGDRVFAIENGPSGFDPENPVHQPKDKFLVLMRHADLARLKTRYLDETTTLVIEEGGREVARGDLSTGEGRLAIEAFIRRFMPKALRGALKILTAPDGLRFTDSRRGFVSIINLASVQALENALGAPVDPLRFRGNLHVEGLAPWQEFDLVDKVLATPSGVRLRITKRIERCAATNVDPATGLRDMQIPKGLMQAFGHVDCGVYAEVLSGGRIAEGDSFAPEQAALALASSGKQ
ncbi:MOSC domain-containing protein [Microvirga alba]|uniref:MOSC domain-containing protein n=1 Tax=Microvirga alba TaxID=2791025 RepID=A0A931BS41_9HYPH|nr:MOSC domain-containing protein [Microvirga alba]MBF9232765.1 MOSC domain-containing protein [Microvirga alba]